MFTHKPCDVLNKPILGEPSFPYNTSLLHCVIIHN